MNNLYNRLEEIGKKPLLFLRNAGIFQLHDFISAYLFAFHDMKIEEKPQKLFPLPFWLFNEFVANLYYYYESTAGWCNIIYQENNNDDEKSFVEFFKLYESFISLKANSCYKFILSKENIEFHYKNKFAPQRVIYFKEISKTEPLYINPIEVNLIELTCDFGYLCLVITDSKSILVNEIYKSEQEAKLYIKMCFGEMPNWEMVQTDNIEFNNGLQY